MDRFRGGAIIRIILAILLAAPALAQVELNPPRAAGVISVDVDVVNVLCTVRDSKGAFAKDLVQEDFQLREDGKPQEIRYFAHDVDTPLTVALLLDVSGSVARVLDIEKAAASRFFSEVLRPGDRALFAGFAQTIVVWQGLTDNFKDLNAAIDQAGPFDRDSLPEFRPHGGTLLYEAVELVAHQKLASVTGRKAIVIISDGLDNGSFNRIEDAVKTSQQADAVVYGIHYEDNPSGRPERTDRGLGALRDMAEPTGGRAFHIDRTVNLDKAFDAIRDDMRSQYSLGYTSTNPARNGSFRKLEVKLARKGLKVQARAGYYARR